MKHQIIFCFLFICKFVSAQNFILTIAINNLNSKKGEIQFGIYNKKENFPLVNKQYKLVIISAEKFTGTYAINNLPKGDYAIAILHDKNSDKICNTNFLGIPKEGYGFSKNFNPVFSAPSFNDCKINLDADTTINIKLHY